MTDRSIPNYQDGYTIEYHRSDDLYHCLHNGEAMSKKDSKPAAYKSLALAKKFMQAQGVQEVVEDPKPKSNGLWTPPPAAIIAPLEEQLAALPEGAPRFVVVEAPYGFYKEQGYANYDRQEKRYESHGVTQSWNNVFQTRERAEQSCNICNTEPPVKWHYDRSFVRALAKGNAEDAGESVADIFFDEESQIDYFGPNSSRKPEPKLEAEPEKECTFVGRDSYQIGDIITDKSGHKYRAVEPSFYISEREASDLEDGFDAFVDVGWHTKAALVEDE